MEKERVGPQVGRPGMFEHSRGNDFSGVQSEDLSLQHLERRSEGNKWNKKKQANESAIVSVGARRLHWVPRTWCATAPHPLLVPDFGFLGLCPMTAARSVHGGFCSPAQ